MFSGLEDMLRTGKYSDLTIRCEGEDVKVHRVIVCSPSKVLSAAVDGGFKEADTFVIELHDEHLSTLRRALSFLYTKDYDVSPYEEEQDTKPVMASETDHGEANSSLVVCETPQTTAATILEASSHTTIPETNHTHGTRPDLFVHADVYAFGDKYDISGLKDLAAAKFKECFIGLDPSSTKDFHQLVREVYHSTPRSDDGLRKTIVECCGQHINDLLTTSSFQEMVYNTEGSGLDLLREVVRLNDEFVLDLSTKTQGLQSTVISLETDKAQLTYSCTNAKRDYHNLDERLDEAIARATKVKCCRNCKKDFGASFDRGSGMPNSKIFLRCNGCGCKH
ncbi:MAG: hypothetical protein M1812_002840 [Candelaria pacifica]|nr:MAG: hypothetical protein M1812_002840 [Candelaria pacifica]